MISWLRESSKFFTDKLHQFVSNFSSIQTLYWDNWIYFSLQDNDSNAKYLAGKRIMENFNSIQNILSRVVIESSYDQGINYTITRFESLNKLLNKNCLLMLQHIPRANTSIHGQIKIKIEYLNFWNLQVNKFGELQTAEIIKGEIAEPIPELKIVV
jgi:hypothetical protein